MTKYDLVCTGCDFKLTQGIEMDDATKACFGAGYCNRCPEQAQLEWRVSP